MKINKQQTGSGTKIALIVSGVVLLACIVLTVLVGTQKAQMSDVLKNIFAIVLCVDIIVFAYTGCKLLGLLKTIKNDRFSPPSGKNAK